MYVYEYTRERETERQREWRAFVEWRLWLKMRDGVTVMHLCVM